MTSPSTQQLVLQVISKYASSGEVTMDTSLTDVGIDSLTMAEVIFDIEEALDVELPNDSEILKRFGVYKVVRDIVSSIERVRAEQSAAVG